MLKTIRNILNSQLYTISLYSRTIAGSLVLFVIARYLSVYDYGLFSSYKNIAFFCLMFANLDFTTYILVSSKANVNEVKLKISLFVTNAVFIALAVCFFSSFTSLESKFLFWLVVIRTFFDSSFFGLILPYFQATKKFNVISVINIIYSSCIMVIALISYILKLSLIKFLILNIILGGINFIQCTYYAKINYLLFINHIKRIFNHLDKSIFAFAGVSIAWFLYSQLQSLYVSTRAPKEQAALYFAAYTIATIIALFSHAQMQTIIPELIKTNVTNVKKIIKDRVIFTLGCTLTIVISMVFFGKFILVLLFGQQYYANAYLILIILLIANSINAVGSIFETYITASGRQKKKIPMQIETMFVTVISLFVLHKYGVIGASYSFLCSAIYIVIRYIFYTNKILRIDEKKEIQNAVQ